MPTLPNPSEGIKTGKLGGVKPFKLPRFTLPKVLDADDARMLVRIVVLSLLLIWVVWLIALTLGIGVRLYLWAMGG